MYIPLHRMKCKIGNVSKIPHQKSSNTLLRINQDFVINRKPTPNFMMSGLTGASPPKFVSFDEIIKAANGMKNMALAHEIAVDKNFQLQKLEPEDGSFHRRVKEIMHKAFWNLLAEQLAEDPPDYSHALVLLKEIKEVIIFFSFVVIEGSKSHT